MDKCPKCGADEAPTRFRASKVRFLCNSWIVDDDYEGGGDFREDAACLKRQLASATSEATVERNKRQTVERQLAAANEKLTAAGRLAQDTQEQAATLSADLVAANERAGRMEKAVRWALGGPGSDFRGRNDGEGQFYWRAELAKLAGLAWDNEAGDYLEVRDA